MELLSVRDLCKTYPGFTLDHVSFSLESGYIMGFIGRNGAGKTTTLKSMLGLVHPDGGTVEMFGMDLRENESACRQQIGVVLGDARYTPQSACAMWRRRRRGFMSIGTTPRTANT